jgi:hypothetical protein
MNEKAWIKWCILSWVLTVALGTIIIVSGRQQAADTEKLKSTIAELEASNQLVSDSINSIIADTKRQLDSAAAIAGTSGKVTAGLEGAIKQCDELTSSLRQVDSLTGLIISTSTKLIETERLASAEREDTKVGDSGSGGSGNN